MLGDFSCRLALQLLGYVYPAYKTFKVVQLPATRSNDTLLRRWCCYWALMAVFTALSPLADLFFFWLPLYYEAKLAFAVYLWANDLGGTQHVWGRWFAPAVSRWEPVLDRRLAESKAMASDWLHSNTMRLVAMAQAKALAWLADMQMRAQQAAAGMGGAGAGGAAAAAGEYEAVRGREARPRRRGVGGHGSPAKRGSGRGGRENEAELEEEEDAARGAPAVVAGKGVEPAVPADPLVARVSSFSLSNFFSARSADMQADDLRAGLKAFPLLASEENSPTSRATSPRTAKRE